MKHIEKFMNVYEKSENEIKSKTYGNNERYGI